MANFCLLLSIVDLAVVAQTTTARDIPNETNKDVVGLTDQKNAFAFGGLGGFAGFGNNGQSVGGSGIGVGVGAGLGVGIGNTNGIGGAGDGNGNNGLGAAAAGGAGTFGGLGGGRDDDGAVPLP